MFLLGETNAHVINIEAKIYAFAKRYFADWKTNRWIERKGCISPLSVHQKQAISWVVETRTQTKTLSKRLKCCHTTTSDRTMSVNNLSWRFGHTTLSTVSFWLKLNLWSMWNSAPSNFQGQTPLNMSFPPTAQDTKGNMWPKVATPY